MEAVHEKGFTDVEAAAEYLLTTGNVEGYSVEKLAPKEHKFEGSSFYPHNQAQFFKAVSREANLLKSRYTPNYFLLDGTFWITPSSIFIIPTALFIF